MKSSLQLPDLHPTWLELLGPEFGKDYFTELLGFVEGQYRDFTVYPPREQIFNALIYTPLEKLTVVIISVFIFAAFFFVASPLPTVS